MSTSGAEAARPARMLTVVGARPQFMKAAAISRAIGRRSDLDEVLVHTGQHYDAGKSDVFFQELGLPEPDITLDIHGGGHGTMTGRMMIALEGAMIAERPDLVLVYGDTNSTLAAALCAAKLNVPVAHVEAGVRSFDRSMPEEVNRIVTDAVSTLRFAPTQAGVRNLAAEGITSGVMAVGDVNYDVTMMLKAPAERAAGGLLESLGLRRGGFALATVHRAASVDNPSALRAVFAYLDKEAMDRPIVLPRHPRTRAALVAAGLTPQRVRLIDPVGPVQMHALLDACAAVYTDSGGLQKEAYFHRKPCVTLRDATEWVETIEAGWNRLWRGPDFTPRREIADYGTGDSADRMVEAITAFLASRAERPPGAGVVA